MMNPKLKQALWLGGGALILLIGGIRMYQNSQKEKEEIEQMEELAEKEAPIRKALDKLGHPGVGVNPYLTEEFLRRLRSCAERVQGDEEKGNTIYTFLQEKGSSEQPEHVCNQWNAQRTELERTTASIKSTQNEAQDYYDTQLKSWEAIAAAQAREPKKERPTQRIAALIRKYYKAAKEMSESDLRSNRAKEGYTALKEQLEKDYKILQKIEAYYKKRDAVLEKSKRQVIGEDNRINRNTPLMREADALMDSIRNARNYDLAALAAPTVLRLPPPPPFVPDVHIVATSDLAETLLAPLVEAWLKDRGATPEEGSGFMWDITNATTRELTVNAPAALQGKDAGKLRIRITTEQDSAEVFKHVRHGEGDASLVLTGRKMNGFEEKRWLPVGKELRDLDPQTKGRAFRARLCSDALIFFRGSNVTEGYLNAAVLRAKSKVYSADDAGRREAADISGFQPEPTDKILGTQHKNVRTLAEENKQSIIMGVWHKDNLSQSGEQAMSVNSTPTLSYAAGLDTPLKNADKRYLSPAEGCAPTETTINSGQYAFSYNITFYRATDPKPEARAAADLMSWAGDVHNKKAEQLVRTHGYVPVQAVEIDPDAKLTNADLPLSLVIPQLMKYGFGYAGDSSWLNGVRIAIPLYYEVGSVTASSGNVNIDPDSEYYTEMQALQLIRELTENKKACLVLVGHSDPQWGKKLDDSAISWQNNLTLSNKRASGVHEALFRTEFPESNKFKHIAFGCSWARPACDISINKGVEEQDNQLSRCRRVEVFVVFPLTED